MKLISIKSEALVISSVTVIWVLLMSQSKPITDITVWLVPAGIVAVYVAFVLWKLLEKVMLASSKKPAAKQPKVKLTWRQNVAQTSVYLVTSLSITMLLNIKFDWFNTWHIVIVAVACLFTVQWMFDKFVWSKCHQAQQ